VNEISFRDALREVLRLEMRVNTDMVVLGENIATWGGASGVTAELVEEFGVDRIIETPVAENAIVGQALGAALGGLSVVLEIYSADFLFCAASEVINDTAKWRFQHRWQKPINLVMRMPMLSSGISAGPEHTQALDGYLHRANGLVVVVPGSVKDAIGVLRAAIRCGDPVVVLEHRRLYDLREDVNPADIENYSRDLRFGSVVLEGTDLTVVAWGWMRQLVTNVAQSLFQDHGISIELVDPVTIKPMDVDTILASVTKTKRLLVVEEAPQTGSIAAEILSRVLEDSVSGLRSADRLTMPDLPNPFSAALESLLIPDEMMIKSRIMKILAP